MTGRARSPGTWSIAVDSVKGFASDELVAQIARIVEGSDELDDGDVGVSADGVVTIISDVAALSFEAAVEIAIVRVESVLHKAGVRFPVDRNRLPVGEGP